MDLCSDGHDEVCFDGPSCPVCDIITAAAKDLEAVRAERDDAVKALAEEGEGEVTG